MEFNVISDLDLHFSTNQLQLLQSITKGMVKQVNSVNKVDDQNEDLDSGIGSDSTVKPQATESAKPTTNKSSSNTSQLSPVDVLLTAGRISCTVYSHGIADKDIHMTREKSPNKKSMKKSPSKQTLEWQVKTEADGQGEYNEFSQGQAQYQDSYLMHMFERKNSVNEDRVIEAGSGYIDPFLFVYISQPHTVISCHREAEKFEMSCYDVLVKGPADLNSLIQGGFGPPENKQGNR